MAEKLDTVQRRALERAASILGGKEKLREYLRAPMHRLDAWLEGRDPLPMAIFLRAIDAFIPPHEVIPVLQRSRELLAAGRLSCTRRSTRIWRQAGPTWPMFSLPGPTDCASRPSAAFATHFSIFSSASTTV